MSHERASIGSPDRSAGAVLKTLPPAYTVSCTHCGRSFALRARLAQTIHIRCAGCGRLFMTPSGPQPEKVETPPQSGERRAAGRTLRGGKTARTRASLLRKRIAVAAFIIAGTFCLGLFSPSLFPSRVRHQWDIEVGMNGGKKATFALYGSAADRIELVYSSFDGGPLSVDSSWTCHRDQAWNLPPDPAKGPFPLGVGFSRAGVPWEIRFAGEGRARIDSGGIVFAATVVRSASGL